MSDKFQRYGSYTKMEFMETCKNLIEAEGMPASLREILNTNLKWADNLPDTAIIKFKDGPNGSIVPIAY